MAPWRTGPHFQRLLQRSDLPPKLHWTFNPNPCRVGAVGVTPTQEGKMCKEAFAWVPVCLLSFCALGNADFKYTVSSEVMGEPLAKRIPQATETTIYVRGGYLRIDLSDGSYVIADLKERRETWVNPRARTYSVLNYDEMFAPHPPGSRGVPTPGQASGRKGPALSVFSTGKTQVLMGQTAQGVVGTLTENADEYYEAESWPAPSVPGYQEVEEFFSKLTAMFPFEKRGLDSGAGSDPAAQKAEIDLWGAMQAAALGAPVWSPAMMRVIVDITGPGTAAKGLPMLQTLRMFRMMTKDRQIQLRPTGQQPQSAANGTSPASSAAGGSVNNGASERQPVTVAEFTFRLTSYSAEPLEGSLFRIPPDYVQTGLSKRDMWPGAILP